MHTVADAEPPVMLSLSGVSAATHSTHVPRTKRRMHTRTARTTVARGRLALDVLRVPVLVTCALLFEPLVMLDELDVAPTDADAAVALGSGRRVGNLGRLGLLQ